VLWALTATGHHIQPLPVRWTGQGGETRWASVLLVLLLAPGMLRDLLLIRIRTWARRRHTHHP